MSRITDALSMGANAANNENTLLTEANKQLLHEVSRVQMDGELLQENMSMLMLKLEDYMWSPIEGWEQDKGFTLQAVQRESDHCRALASVNPIIRKGLAARFGYVWGRGVRINPEKKSERSSDKIEKFQKEHYARYFSTAARQQRETQLSTDGNIWTMRHQRTNQRITVPLVQIKGFIVDTVDPSHVLYWKREYTVAKTNFQTGTEINETMTTFIPAIDNDKPVASIAGHKVERDFRMIHTYVNRQEGWVLGLPDLLAAKFWTQGHKEMFEAGHTYTMAQGQFAAKVIANNAMGGQMAAAHLAAEPRRDYETGEVNNVGGTFVGAGSGLDLQLMGKMTGGVDFKVYDRVTGLIAAALGVPVAVLLAEAASDDVTLDETTVSEMRIRQELWTDFYEELFGSIKVAVVWPRIKQESRYRQVQDLEIANKSNKLHPHELRLLTLEAYGLEGDPYDLPKAEELPEVVIYGEKLKLDKKYGNTAKQLADSKAEPATTPEQGVDAGIGKLSDGADAKDARDAGEQEHTKN